MKKQLRKLWFLGVVLMGFWGAEASSFVQGGLGGGYRGAVDGSIGSGPEISAFFHIDPIPVVPVSFGFSYAYIALSDVPNNKKIDLGELSFELTAWLPFSFLSMTPYIRGRVPFYSFFMGEDAANLSGEAFTGVHGTLGLRWSFIPMFSLFAEGGIGTSSYKLEGKQADLSYTIFGGLQISL